MWFTQNSFQTRKVSILNGPKWQREKQVDSESKIPPLLSFFKYTLFLAINSSPSHQEKERGKELMARLMEMMRKGSRKLCLLERRTNSIFSFSTEAASTTYQHPQSIIKDLSRINIKSDATKASSLSLSLYLYIIIFISFLYLFIKYRQ